ncbi:hypothetical protein RI065_02120 [Mycoplasmatota bacterium zrk1]
MKKIILLLASFTFFICVLNVELNASVSDEVKILRTLELYRKENGSLLNIEDFPRPSKVATIGKASYLEEVAFNIGNVAGGIFNSIGLRFNSKGKYYRQAVEAIVEENHRLTSSRTSNHDVIEDIMEEEKIDTLINGFKFISDNGKEYLFRASEINEVEEKLGFSSALNGIQYIAIINDSFRDLSSAQKTLYYLESAFELHSFHNDLKKEISTLGNQYRNNFELFTANMGSMVIKEFDDKISDAALDALTGGLGSKVLDYASLITSNFRDNAEATIKSEFMTLVSNEISLVTHLPMWEFENGTLESELSNGDVINTGVLFYEQYYIKKSARLVETDLLINYLKTKKGNSKKISQLRLIKDKINNMDAFHDYRLEAEREIYEQYFSIENNIDLSQKQIIGDTIMGSGEIISYYPLENLTMSIEGDNLCYSVENIDVTPSSNPLSDLLERTISVNVPAGEHKVVIRADNGYVVKTIYEGMIEFTETSRVSNKPVPAVNQPIIDWTDDIYTYSRWVYWNEDDESWYATYSKIYAESQEGFEQVLKLNTSLEKSSVVDSYQSYNRDGDSLLWWYESIKEATPREVPEKPTFTQPSIDESKDVYEYMRWIYWNEANSAWYSTYSEGYAKPRGGELQVIRLNSPMSKGDVVSGEQAYKLNGTGYSWWNETIEQGDPIELKVGDKVHIKGYYYNASDGTGASFYRDGEYYIIRYYESKWSYYPYLLSKTKDGTPMGWARAEDLTFISR